MRGAPGPYTQPGGTPTRARAGDRRQSSALIVTLLFLSLLTAVVLAFLLMARTERIATDAHFERMLADELAHGALAECIAILRRETAYSYEATNEKGATHRRWRNYITQPGGLLVPAPPDGSARDAATQSRLLHFIPLSSGRPTATTWPSPALAPAILNVPTLFDDSPARRLLTDRLDANGAPPPMRLKWIYVREDRRAAPAAPERWTRELDFSEAPDLTDAARPIIGRYAWWADDESAKVNYNLAWKRDPGPAPSVHSNPSRPSHPSRVNLMGLLQPSGTPATEAIADAVFRWRDRSPHRPFNSFADARQASPIVVDTLEFNKFELTHYNHDPDTTFTGEDRILLTTRRDLVPKFHGAYARRFLDILRDDIDIALLDSGVLEDIAGGQQDWRADPGGGATLPNKFDAAVRMLVRYLQEEHWPIADGVSVQGKYYSTTRDNYPETRLAQLAVNIIDYVRAKESRLPVVAPLSYGLDEQGRYTLHAGSAYGAPGSHAGVSRAPYITEMALHVSDAALTKPLGAETTPVGWPMADGAPKPLYPCTFKVELHLPLGYQVIDSSGILGFDLVPNRTVPFPANARRAWFLTLGEARRTTPRYYAISPTTGAAIPLGSHATGALPILRADVVGSTYLRPGNRITITKTVYREEPHAIASTAELRTTLHQGAGGADGLLLAPLDRWPPVAAAPQWEAVTYVVGPPATTTPENMSSVETDDPRCQGSKLDWLANIQDGNTFGALNSVSTLGRPPTRSSGPQQDTDASGLLTDASVSFPPPKGVGSNADLEGADCGLVTSLGELGSVCTGNDASSGGTPWRSLRLQPTSGSSPRDLPDWALLDLFSVLNITTSKVKESRPLFVPHETSIGGRVNINSHVEPFREMERSTALRAAFTGSPGLRQKSDAAAIAQNIFTGALAAGANPGKAYGRFQSPDGREGQAFEMTGEICEIAGVADGGEQSENLVRDVISLFTQRGGVFSVYTIGQSLAQTPAGQLVITSERRQQSMIERYLDTLGTRAPEDDEIRFRTIYFRNLSP